MRLECSFIIESFVYLLRLLLISSHARVEKRGFLHGVSRIFYHVSFMLLVNSFLGPHFFFFFLRGPRGKICVVGIGLLIHSHYP